MSCPYCGETPDPNPFKIEELASTQAKQAFRVLRIIGDTGCEFTSGPTLTGWFVRIERGPTFIGADIVDALAQLATSLALTELT